MGTIRVEYVPIKKYYLGLLRLDHLQIVYEDETSLLNNQADWFVLEGTHDGGLLTGTLGVLGEEFDTELTVANGVNPDELVAAIGTPESRGSRVLYQGSDASLKWQTMQDYGLEIQAQTFPYEGIAWPFGPHPIMNSSSVVATLLYVIGIDVNLSMPFGVRFSPGTSTLLGTTGDDDITIRNNFTQVAGGEGFDTLRGTDNLLFPQKFYGGLDDDTIVWSKGENIVHGGQARLPYALDGKDTIDYSGVGDVYIISGRHPVEHKTPNFIADFTGGQDQLFSIEEVDWFRDKDNVRVGEGVDLLEAPVKLDLNDAPTDGKGDELGFLGSSKPLIINAVNDTMISVQTIDNQGLDAGFWAESVEWIAGSAGDDLIYTGATQIGAEGGAGGDLIDARLVPAFTEASPTGWDIEIDGGTGDDIIVSNIGWTTAKGGDGADKFILSGLNVGALGTEFRIEDASLDDSLFIPLDYFKEVRGDYEGSDLLQLKGAPFMLDTHITRSYPATGYTDNNGVEHVILDFVGEIFYEMDGADLLIHLFLGTRETYLQDNGPGEPPGPEITVTTLDPLSETYIRVADWQEGELGISFPLTFDPDIWNSTANPIEYPGWLDAVNDTVGPSAISPGLEARPDAYLPQDLKATALAAAAPMQFAAFALAAPLPQPTEGDDIIEMTTDGPYQIPGLGGNDTLVGSNGGDVIDGGSGDDAMSGGRGNDTYFVDSTEDTITELARGGFDHVYSLVDYALGAELEHVTLLGSAVSATGNSLRNTVVGNALDNILISGDGDDTLAGNEGRDILRGGIGSDGYVYENGDGDDIIYEIATDAGDDVLVLAGQIRPEDVYFLRDPAAMDDLVVRIADGGSITIKDYYLGNGSGLEGFEFLQGTVWNAAEVALRASSAIIASGSPPVAADDAYVYAGSNSLRLPVAALLDNDIDPDGDLLTVISVASALEGGAVLVGDEIVVTSSGGPDPRAVFNYTVSDGHGGTATATAEITFWPNSAPQIVSSSFAPVTEDTAAAGSISASDAEGDTLFFALKSGAGPQKGTVSFNPDGTFLYTPLANANGADAFTVVVSDAFDAAVEQTFAFDIAAVNDSPVIAQTSLAPVTEDLPAQGSITATDADGDALSFTLKTGAGPQNGTVEFGVNGAFTYTPFANATGGDAFTLVASDGNGGTAETTVNLSIAAANDAPVVTISSIGPAVEDTAVSGSIVATDADGDALSFSVKAGSGPQKGSIVFGAGGAFTYTPTANANGAESFTAVVSDGNGGTAETTFSFMISPVNDAPIIASATLAPVIEDTIAVGAIVAIDADGDALSYAIKAGSGPQKGAVTFGTNGAFTYSPSPNVNGQDAFTVVVSDASGSSVETAINLSIAAVNDMPTAVNDSGFSLATGTSLTISSADLLANDSDVDGNPLTILAVSNAIGGTVTLAQNGSLLFAANAGYAGPASFGYTLSDGQGGTGTANVALSVTPSTQQGLTLIGTANRDTLIGTEYDDTFIGKGARDTLRGLGGNDTFKVNGDDGLDIADGGSGYDVILGGSLDDVIRVNSNLSNLISIEAIDGGGGYDKIAATEGDDVLDFSSMSLNGIELISLGSGHDTVKGSAGNDTFLGGYGMDRYVFDANSGHDTILDFHSVELGLWWIGSDVIDVSDAGFSSYQELFQNLHQAGRDTVLEIDQNTSVTLKDVPIWALWPSHFEI